MLRVAFFLVLISVSSAIAQTGNDFLSDIILPRIDPTEFHKPNLKWNYSPQVQVALNQALTHIDEDEFGVASGVLDTLIQKEPTLWEAYFYRSICNRVHEVYDDAERDLFYATKYSPDNMYIDLELGKTYLLKEDYDQAETIFRKTIRQYPDSCYGYFELGNTLFFKGDLIQAGRQYQKCHDIDPHYADAYVGQGIIKLTVKENRRGALNLFDKALQEDSLNAKGLYWRGLTYMAFNDFTKAEMDWSRWVRSDPTNNTTYLMRGLLNLTMENIDKAFMDLKKVVSSIPWDGNRHTSSQTKADHQLDLYYATNYMSANAGGLGDAAYQKLKEAYCWMVMGENREAIQNLNNCIKEEESGIGYFFRGIAYEHLGQHDSAFFDYETSLRFDPNNYDALKKQAIYRYELKDWKTSMASFAKMISLYPEMTVTYRIRGLTRVALKDYAGAILDLSRYLETDSTDALSYENRGHSQFLIQAHAQAYGDYRQALKYGSRNVDLYVTCLDGYLELKDTTSFYETLSEYKARDKEDGTPYAKALFYFKKFGLEDSTCYNAKSAMDRHLYYKYRNDARRELSFCRYREHNYDAALELMAVVLERNPLDFEVRYLRAKIFIEKGELGKAKNDLKALKEVGYSDSEQLLNSLNQKR